MMISSFGEGVLLCVLFYLLPLKSSRSAHRLATGRILFLSGHFAVVSSGRIQFNDLHIHKYMTTIIQDVLFSLLSYGMRIALFARFALL
jgi:hypothetical protein